MQTPIDRDEILVEQPDRSMDRVDHAVRAIASGQMVVVVDDVERENEGDLIMAAEHANESQVAFMVRHTSGVLCVALDKERCDELELPLMVEHDNRSDYFRTAFTVSVDARTGTTTGISASDRATTIRALAGAGTGPDDLLRPGHVFPLRAQAGGVLSRRGHTEAAVDLCRLAGRRPAGVLAEIVADDGTMARRPDLCAFARRHGLPIMTIADLAAYRSDREPALQRMASARVPVLGRDFVMSAYVDGSAATEHVALVLGPVPIDSAPLVRVHSECLTGDIFGSQRCDCGDQLAQSLRLIRDAGAGVVIYLRGHEGRGIGLVNKLRAYELQDAGLDTVDANIAQGLPVDSRDYAPATRILDDLDIRHVRLLTNNPAKTAALRAGGITVVEQVPLAGAVTLRNVHYLRAKQRRLGHDLELDSPSTRAHTAAPTHQEAT